MEAAVNKLTRNIMLIKLKAAVILLSDLRGTEVAGIYKKWSSVTVRGHTAGERQRTH